MLTAIFVDRSRLGSWRRLIGQFQIGTISEQVHDGKPVRPDGITPEEEQKQAGERHDERGLLQRDDRAETSVISMAMPRASGNTERIVRRGL